MSKISVLAFVLFAATDALATPKLIVPVVAESTLQYQTGSRGYFEFAGKIWITNTLVARWVVAVDETEPNLLEVTLIPDPAMAPIMPSYVGFSTTAIHLVDAKLALKTGFNRTNARSLRMRDVARIERRGQFLLSDFVVSLNWDAQSAAARLVLVKADNVAPVFVYARSCGYSDSVGG